MNFCFQENTLEIFLIPRVSDKCHLNPSPERLQRSRAVTETGPEKLDIKFSSHEEKENLIHSFADNKECGWVLDDGKYMSLLFLVHHFPPQVPWEPLQPLSCTHIAFFYFIVEKTNFLVPKLRAPLKKPSYFHIPPCFHPLSLSSTLSCNIASF